MSKISSNALKFLVLGSMIFFILIFAALFFHSTRALNIEPFSTPALKTSITVRTALIRSLDLLPALVIFLYIISFSIFYTLSPFQKETLHYASLAAPSFVMLLLFVMVISLSEFLFIPTLQKERENIRYRARTANLALSRARELNLKNDLEGAVSALKVYREIDEINREANELYDGIAEKIDAEHTRLSRPLETVEPEKEEPSSYYQRGKSAYEKGDYYHALFYLERASALHGDNREIRDLYERTKEKVDRLLGALTEEQEKTKRLIQRKERALAHLEKKEYHEAYAILNDLSARYPQLSDLGLYLEEAKSELLKIDFDPHELEELEWLPSFDSIMFRDERGYLNTIQRIIPYKGQFYFFNITRYRTRDGKTSVSHYRYGKWIEGRIRLKNVKGFEKLSPRDEESSYIYSPIEPGYLLYLNERETLLGQLTIFERLSLTSQLEKCGLDIESQWAYLSKKFGAFFSVYVISLVLAGIAWSKRSIYEFPPGFRLIVFIITAPVLSYLLRQLYLDANSFIIYLHRYVVRFAFKSMNVTVYTVLINAVVAAAATLFYLSQSSRVE